MTTIAVVIIVAVAVVGVVWTWCLLRAAAEGDWAQEKWRK